MRLTYKHSKVSTARRCTVRLAWLSAVVGAAVALPLVVSASPRTTKIVETAGVAPATTVARPVTTVVVTTTPRRPTTVAPTTAPRPTAPPTTARVAPPTTVRYVAPTTTTRPYVATTRPYVAPTTTRPYVAPTVAPRAQAFGHSSACGGILPPCYVLARESGGNPRAENPTSTASGLWQFVDGTWHHFGGYSHASFAPIAVQNARAVQVWAGGAGCSNWAAC